jgi:chaperonin GroEL
METKKVKSTGKEMMVKGPALASKVLDTMKTVSALVGATLGPGGHSVLLERQEHNIPNFVTKDGVTVFKSIGFQDPVAHAIMESARDASIRTANEAGDGTTTATILAYSIVEEIAAYTKAHPEVSPQKVIRELQTYFRDTIEPQIRKESIPCDSSTEEGRKMLHDVAKLSANGDDQLADAVMEALALVGDRGNVTITEISGPSAYEVERIEGYPINSGYEDSCGRFYNKFINDPGAQRVYMEKPVFVLVHGRIIDIQQIIFIMERIGMAWQTDGYNHNVVLVATGFSESVLGQLAANWMSAETLNVYPIIAPMNAIPNSQYDFLLDLSAVTGAKIYDALNNPLPRTHEELLLADLGHGVDAFEATKFRSTVLGQCDEVLILERVDILEKQLAQSAGSILEASYLQERIGRISGGIAKLKVIGSSNGELRERRDRAEDAIMAVRKAIESGCLPGGGWMLVRLAKQINERFSTYAGFPKAWYEFWKKNKSTYRGDVLSEVLAPALLEPFFVLYRNLGWDDDEIADDLLKGMLTGNDERIVYDALNNEWGHADTLGILDSTPAVLEAIRNSLSIATLLGTLGGAIVFPRDETFERAEARENNAFLRDIKSGSEADERI